MKVAIAIIKDEQDRVLITQRPLKAPHGGFWEFPGGKIEANETAECALVREIKEELGIEIQQHQWLYDVYYEYATHPVELKVFLVTQFQGKPSCLEGQLDMKWEKIALLDKDHFPKANHEVLRLLTK